MNRCCRGCSCGCGCSRSRSCRRGCSSSCGCGCGCSCSRWCRCWCRCRCGSNAWNEGVSLRDVDEVEEHAADASDRWDGVGGLRKRHGAGGNFVETIVNCAWLVDVCKWDING